MDWAPRSAIGRLFDSGQGLSNRLIARWVVLRCLGGIYFSAFFSLIFQIRGLIGPEGILPAGEYLQSVARSLGYARFWFAPTLLWISSGPRMLTGLCWVGMIASLLLLFNVWPRGSLVVCFVCFLSFVSAAEDFSGYQSDGMLLEAGFISLFFAPPGFRPGWGAARPPSRASLFLLQWEWFRIYFESGIAKIASGDPQWRHFTAMDEYYQNGPLPTWVGWYVQHLPHWFHASTSAATLVLELIFVWMMFLPRRLRMVCFLIVTPWEAGVILTANYTFLNYLVLALGFLLLDDKFLLPFLPERWTRAFLDQTQRQERHHEPAENEFSEADRGKQGGGLKTALKTLPLSVSALMLSWIFYATTVQMIWMLIRLSLPTSPVTVLEPFRIANRYGLFAVMTRGRYEIEFQGSQDGEHWVAYPFRYKPQDTSKPPGIYAPYQPRFDWNLWFASLGFWRENAIVPSTEERLLSNAPDVLKLFAGHPFPNQPPRLIRAVLWQYWFTTVSERRAQGQWWRRQWLGLYAPTLQREADGKIAVVEWPTVAPRQ
jgi:lipase maturation factor 1